MFYNSDKKHFFVFISFLLLLGIKSSIGLDNGLGIVPPMGWNTWNRYQCNINQTVIYSNADRLKELGLDQLGYIYVNIDDCWNTEERDEQGHLIVDKVRFPDGMKAIGDYLHSNGLKFGIYNSAGKMTCEGRAGSLDHEDQDAQDFESWGVDYLKYDNCFNEGIPAIERYQTMKEAIDNLERPIYYSLCNWGLEDVWKWGQQTGNSWRTTGDILDNWISIKYNFEINQMHPEVAGPGGWNDPDMLEVGNGGLQPAEERTHFALWCFAKAPLILGCNLNNITNESLAIIRNINLIKINQDSLGLQARCLTNCTKDIEIYGAQQIDDNKEYYFGIVIVNWHDKQRLQTLVDFKQIGATSKYNDTCEIVDLWTGDLVGKFLGYYFTPFIEPHDNLAYKIKCRFNTVKIEETPKTMKQRKF